MKLEVVLELKDVYGGDGFARSIIVKEKKLKRKRTNTQTRSDIGVAAGGSEIEEEEWEETEKPVHTFDRDAEGRPTLRVGGVHGKVWGALKEAAGQLRILHVEPFTKGYKGIVGMMNVTPIVASLEMNGSEIAVRQLPQILNGMGNKMIFDRYDVIPEARLKVFISFPDQLKTPVERMARHLENMGLFNKRRTIAKVASMKPVKGDKEVTN